MGMYVKIWDIKPSGSDGQKGIQTTIKYITSDLKTLASENVEDEIREASNYSDDSFSTVLSYMQNMDKTKVSDDCQDKWISGYLCNPDRAGEEFREVKRRNLEAVGRTLEDDKGATAFHIVQSFPKGCPITPQQVHQAGLELCKKIGLYQAIVCTHAHPVVDKDGVLKGTQLHNHILINSHTIDPVKQNGTRTAMKYNDSKSTYAQLRLWNDEIAHEMNLPVFSKEEMEKDDSFTSSNWFENEQSKKGLSWKDKVKKDIDSVRSDSHNWAEYCTKMKELGYEIKVGKYVSYKHKDSERAVRDARLGDEYSKENLEKYWNDKEKFDAELKEEQEKKEKETDDKKHKYYQIKDWNKEVNQKPYVISMYNSEGHRRTMLELLIILAISVIKDSGEKHYPTTDVNDIGNPNMIKSSAKVKMMYEALVEARTAGVTSIQDIEDKLKDAGTRFSRVKFQYGKINASFIRMEKINNTIENMEKYKPVIDKLNEMPDGEEKEKFKEDHKEDIAIYKVEMAALYKSKCSTPEDIAEFKERFAKISEAREELSVKLDTAKRDYTKYKKMEYKFKLAQDKQFCYGPMYQDIGSPIRQEDIDSVNSTLFATPKQISFIESLTQKNETLKSEHISIMDATLLIRILGKDESERNNNEKEIYNKYIEVGEKEFVSRQPDDKPMTDKQKIVIELELKKHSFAIKNKELTMKDADIIINVLKGNAKLKGENKEVYEKYVVENNKQKEEEKEKKNSHDER